MLRRPLPVARPRERIDLALRAVGLADRAGDPCGALSKGLRQRVALARALLSDPEVLFLDEPTAGLDPVAAHEVHELIDELRRRGVTIFLTTTGSRRRNACATASPS
jgi:ABC-2 type transport system ATP-binding protein